MNVGKPTWRDSEITEAVPGLRTAGLLVENKLGLGANPFQDNDARVPHRVSQQTPLSVTHGLEVQGMLRQKVSDGLSFALHGF